MRRHCIALALISSGCLEERVGRLQADTGSAAEVDAGDDTLTQTLVEIPLQIRTFAGPIQGETCYDVQVIQGDRVTW